jgi:hypothetical protein
MARTDSIISRFPGFYQSGDRLSMLYKWMEVFGAQVDIAEEDLIRVMRSHWVNTANNEDSKGFNTSEKGDLDKIFAMYLEALGGTSLLKQVGRRSGEDGIEDDKIYRDRIKGLINVLRSGASTKEGIIAIVAANLGIVGDSDEAQSARKMIRIEEFLPEQAPTQPFDVALYQEFQVRNHNAIAITPQVRVMIAPLLQNPVVNPTLINLNTGEFSRYVGTLLPGQELIWLTNGTAILEGQPINLVGSTPKIGPRFTTMRIEAGYGMPAGKFDIERFDFSRFDVGQIALPGRFDETLWDESIFSDGSPILNLKVDTILYTPGTFNVRIPWDIPGYSEVLETLQDKPRDQIPFIVQKVKAAGTYAIVTYEKYFTEEHEQHIALTLQDHMPAMVHEMAEVNFDILSTTTPYPGGLNHELSDALVLTGMFDFTSFDSLNTFA